MKKLLLFAGLLCVASVSISCSSDNDAPAAEPRIKRISAVLPGNEPFPYYVDFIYENDLLVAIVNDGGETEIEYDYIGQQLTHYEASEAFADFTYDGNWPTLIIGERTGGQNAGDVTEAVVTYTNDQLTQMVFYPENSTVHGENFLWENGNLTMKQLFTVGGGTTRYEYTYDQTKHNPFRNMSQVLRNHCLSEFWSIITRSENACLSKTFYHGDSTTPLTDLSLTFDMEYNEDGYPIQIEIHRMSNNELMHTIAIEYE